MRIETSVYSQERKTEGEEERAGGMISWGVRVSGWDEEKKKENYWLLLTQLWKILFEDP